MITHKFIVIGLICYTDNNLGCLVDCTVGLQHQFIDHVVLVNRKMIAAIRHTQDPEAR